MKKSIAYKLSVILLLITLMFALTAAAAVYRFDPYGMEGKIIASERSSYLNPPYPITSETQGSDKPAAAEASKRITYKLFGIFPIRSVECETQSEKVYLGGFPLGINLNLDHILITSTVGVVTADGVRYPTENCDIACGDVLLSLNGERLRSVNDIVRILGEAQSDDFEIAVRRNDTVTSYRIKAATDVLTGKRRIGLVLQDCVAGIGTMTFVQADSKRFAALGHPIKDAFGNDYNDCDGKIFSADIQSVVRGQKGKAGELNGTFNVLSQGLGRIETSNCFGIFGQYDADCAGLTPIEFGDRNSVTPGKAYIYTTVDGGAPKPYEIQIVKVNKQASAKDKSMVIRVVSKELLAKTGGIVQGMSGSPIVQNDRLVGAVTHVFINDPTKGYGLFAEWMR